MMRLYKGTAIQSERTLTASPLVLPHIPEEPTPAEVEAVAQQLGYGIHYYLTTPTADVRHEFQAVLGINWQGPEESSLAVVYIHDVPYLVSKVWLLENIQV